LDRRLPCPMTSPSTTASWWRSRPPAGKAPGIGLNDQPLDQAALIEEPHRAGGGPGRRRLTRWSNPSTDHALDQAELVTVEAAGNRADQAGRTE